MDTLTHALSGALLARATAPARPSPGELGPNARMAAGFAAAAFPDVDFGLRLTDTLTYLNWHQGPTHSLVLLPVWAYALAQLFAWIARRRYHWREFFAPAFLGIAIHIGGDLLTAYGTMLLAPLTVQRFSVPLAFVIDPYITAILAGGLVAALAWPRKRTPALAALAALGCYVGLQGALHFRALEIGEARAQLERLAGASVHALPQPLTPFNWKIIVAHGERYDEALVNLWRTRRPAQPGPEAGTLRQIAAGYQPAAAAEWKRHAQFGDTTLQTMLAREAWAHAALADFRRFARFPALDRVETEGGRACVWFVDLRFTLPALPPSFRYGACRSAAADSWRLERVHGAFWID